MIKIFAKLIVKEECIEEFKATAEEIVAKSRAEEGNIMYTLNQSRADKTEFAFIEIWKDQEAIDIHGKTEHFTTILPKLASMCTQTLPPEMFEEVTW